MVKYYADNLIKIALNEVGYLEKETNEKLDNKSQNVGDNNYTKYGKAMGCNGQYWCDAFVDWCFKETFSDTSAKKLLGGYSNYTPTSAQYFKNMKQWYLDNPKIGDVVFFKNTERICHTGIVYKVDAKYVYTIEGNTSSGIDVVANGGGVFKKSYLLSNTKIAGYGRPNYDKENIKPTTTTLNTWVKRLQKTIGAEVDGVAGKETLSKCPTVKLGSKGDVVKLLQEKLSVTADGEIDAVSIKTIKTWQKKNGLTADGIFGQNSWKKLLS